MSLRKFRSVEEMNESQRPSLETDPERLLARIAALFEFSRRFAPWRPVGVFKFRSQEESNAWRLAWTRKRVREMRQRERP
ncbi:MAG: hypothetical protein AB1758_18315 [Candidatus Eremiobacterota bacterium]